MSRGSVGRRARSLVAVGALASLAVADASCSSTTDSNSRPTPPDAAPIVIGVVLSLTGSGLSFPAAAEQDATRVAQLQLNALGGVLGRPLDLRIVDDASSPAKTKEIVAELATKGAVAIIGPTGSPSAVEAQKVAFDLKIPMISSSASAPALSTMQPKRDRYFFRTAASHALQSKALAILAYNRLPGGARCKKLAVVYSADAYGKPIADGVKAEYDSYKTSDASVNVLMKSVDPKVKASYAEELDEVVAANVECQMLITFPDVGARYMREFRRRQADKPDLANIVNIGGNGLKNESFITSGRESATGPTAGEGMYVTIADTNPPTREYNDFKSIFTSVYALRPGQVDLDEYVANHYDAIVLVALAIQEAGTATDRTKVRDALFKVSREGQAFGPAELSDAFAALRKGANIQYSGASGSVAFDDNGDVISDFIVWKIDKDGKFELSLRFKPADLK